MNFRWDSDSGLAMNEKAMNNFFRDGRRRKASGDRGGTQCALKREMQNLVNDIANLDAMV